MKKNQIKNNYIVAVIVTTLILSVTGATYAYFAISATNDNTISGTAATANMTLSVTRITPINEIDEKMVPQLSYNPLETTEKNTLKLAINRGCMDSNGNMVCQIYKVVIYNGSTANLRLKEQIKLTDEADSKFNNLKWYIISTENNATEARVNATPTYTYGTVVSKYGNTKAETVLGTERLLNKNTYRYYYIVIWIEELGENQDINAASNKQDYGTFRGQIEVDAIDINGNKINGLTSTFTG